MDDRNQAVNVHSRLSITTNRGPGRMQRQPVNVTEFRSRFQSVRYQKMYKIKLADPADTERRKGTQKTSAKQPHPDRERPPIEISP